MLFLTTCYSGMVVLAVRLLPHKDPYQDYKAGISSDDIIQGKLKPNYSNATWVTGELFGDYVQIKSSFRSIC